MGRDNPVDATQKIYATFQVNNGKLYVPVIILSINHNIKFLENIRQGFKRTLFWNKYRCEITTLPKYNNLDYLIHQHLEILIDCLFFHSKMLILREILLINPTGQMYVCEIFVEHSHDIFPEYSEKVPYENPGNIPK